MAKRALIALAEGFEDIEAIAPIDVLTRAGLDVTVASPAAGPVRAAYGNTILTTASFDSVATDLFDAIILPGGVQNAQTLAADHRIVELVRRHNAEGRLVAAICASPSLVLGEAADIVRGRNATGDPGFNDRLAAAGATVREQHVVVDQNMVTGMGPGAALKFALAVTEYLAGREETQKLASRWRLEG